MIQRILICLLACTCLCVKGFAQDIKAGADGGKSPHTSAIYLSVGSTNVMDTYLSPYSYKGSRIDVMSEKQYEHTMHRFSVHGGWMKSMARNVNEYDFGLAYGVAHHFTVFRNDAFKVKVGPMGYANLGCLYNERNGNNPAQAKASMMADVSALVTYDFAIKGRRCSVEYSIDAPFLGIAYSPQFGQSYYEEFVLGDYDHNVIFATFANTPSLRQRLVFSFPLVGRRFHLGYNGIIEQSKYNNLRYHAYTNEFVIGIDL